MYIKDKEVFFTAADYKGFNIQEVCKEEVEHKLILEKEDKTLKLKLELGICVFSLFLLWTKIINQDLPNVICIVSVILLIASFCSLMITIITWKLNNKLFNSSKWVKLELRVIDRLPEEDDSFYCYEEPDTIKKYYPLLVRDLKTDYISKVYVDKETYYFCENGKVFTRNFKLNIDNNQ